MKKLRFMLLMLALNAGSAWAMASRPVDPNAPQPPAWAQWMPIIVMVGVFYFFLIRPQSQQRKKREEMMNNLKKGDKVLTQGGIIATIVSTGPKILEVKLNEEVKVKILRSGVQEVITDQQALEAVEPVNGAK